MRIQFIIENDANALFDLLPQIQALADSEKETLGFLPEAALRDAIVRRRLLALTADNKGVREFAGYLLHSGVFPNAKIQQIAIVQKFRKAGAASVMMKALVSELERIGFMTIKAEVASDLPPALHFYAKNGFEVFRTRAGGQARNRTIVVHVRELESDSLFSSAANNANPEIELGIRRRSAGDTPLFAFDLNVYFDFAKNRDESEKARQLFGAALGHDIRLAVADELVAELRRTSNLGAIDPILQLALHLPRLPKIDRRELDAMAARIHDLVFVTRKAKGTGSRQALSDARHLAHAALARASAFVTRDGPILAARTELLSTIGIDVATLDEMIALLPPEPHSAGSVSVQGEGFASAEISDAELSSYLTNAKVPSAVISEFRNGNSGISLIRREAISENGRVVAVGALKIPKGVAPVARLLVHVRPEHVDCDLFADFTLDSLIRLACQKAAVTIELVHLPGQSSINSYAKSRGFLRIGASASYSKIALGKPLTSSNWSHVVQEVRRRTGVVLPDQAPVFHGDRREVVVTTPKGNSILLDAGTLEDMLSPTIFIWPGRNGVIVPITRLYADQLLGTSRQPNFNFIANRDAAFLSRRAYVNSPRTAKHMRPDRPILFYESKRKGGGRGAVVAVARIVDAVVVCKRDVSDDGHKRLVVDDVGSFSASDDVLLTTFDNLFVIPQPVPFRKLKEIDAIGRVNLISPVSLCSEQVTAILTQGWSSEKVQ